MHTVVFRDIKIVRFYDNSGTTKYVPIIKYEEIGDNGSFRALEWSASIMSAPYYSGFFYNSLEDILDVARSFISSQISKGHEILLCRGPVSDAFKLIPDSGIARLNPLVHPAEFMGFVASAFENVLSFEEYFVNDSTIRAFYEKSKGVERKAVIQTQEQLFELKKKYEITDLGFIHLRLPNLSFKDYRIKSEKCYVIKIKTPSSEEYLSGAANRSGVVKKAILSSVYTERATKFCDEQSAIDVGLELSEYFEDGFFCVEEFKFPGYYSNKPLSVYPLKKERP